jgi:hypothetical protein
MPFVNADIHIRHCGAYALSVRPIIEVACIRILGAHSHQEPSRPVPVMKETRRECLNDHQRLDVKPRVLRRVVYQAKGKRWKSNPQEESEDETEHAVMQNRP